MLGAAEVHRLSKLSASALFGEGACVPGQRSLPHDKRFRSEAWHQWPFAIYAEALLAAERWCDEATKAIPGPTPHHLGIVNFMMRQALDFVSPSNFPATNPEILQATLNSGGTNLLRGAAFAADDFRRIIANERPAGTEAFEPAQSVALTAGRVVHRTHLAEIIQYTPTTKAVRPEPVVIIPAWIMRYYILDLRPENSMVRHLLDQGFTVFMVSWLNPGPEDRDIGFDDYRMQGVMPALNATLAITGAKRAHAVGYCIGGTLLATAAAAMARDNDERLASLTFLAAQTDLEEAGELKLFIDESQLALLDDMMAESGVFEGSRMGGTFHLLRSNDLIWSRLVHHYLLGQYEEMDDLTAWSTDTTRLPARMQSEYLRKFYLHNDLAEGRYRVGEKTVSLGDIKTPIFAVSAEHDYVAPWKSVYKLHALSDSDVTFVLASGGHNRGIIAPPDKQGLHYHIATTPQPARRADPDDWLAGSKSAEGSWWVPWFDWLKAHSGPLTAPPLLGNAEAGFRATMAAPGTYVHGR
jgi:polyhydroxyalkanoate synthase